MNKKRHPPVLVDVGKYWPYASNIKSSAEWLAPELQILSIVASNRAGFNF